MRVVRSLTRALPSGVAFSALLFACGEEPTQSPLWNPSQSDTDSIQQPGGGNSNNGSGNSGDTSFDPDDRDPTTTPNNNDGSNNSGGSSNNGSDSEWCKVKEIFDTHCVVCHDGEGTANTPMGLTSYADLTAESVFFPGTKVYTRVGARIHDTENPMPPQGELTQEELARLDAWIAAGAPGSVADQCAPPKDEPGAQGEDEWPADCEEKYKLLANDGKGGPFTVRAGAQFYQDFTFTPPWKGDVHGVAFRPVVNNKRVLHHYIVYDGSGAFLVGWSPGKKETPLPPDVGHFLPGSGTLKMTVHYYNSLPGAQPEQDASGVEICITRNKRAKTSAVMPFAANPSVNASGMSVSSSTCTVQAKEPIHIITSSPHMHGLGVHAKFTVERASGEVEVIHDKPFNFEEQTTHPIDVVVNNGDKITTTCIYENTTGRRVSFGTRTEDEMCFNFAQYYPMCGMTCRQSDPLAEVWSRSQGGGCPGSGGLSGFGL